MLNRFYGALVSRRRSRSDAVDSTNPDSLRTCSPSPSSAFIASLVLLCRSYTLKSSRQSYVVSLDSVGSR